MITPSWSVRFSLATLGSPPGMHLERFEITNLDLTGTPTSRELRKRVPLSLLWGSPTISLCAVTKRFFVDA